MSQEVFCSSDTEYDSDTNELSEILSQLGVTRASALPPAKSPPNIPARELDLPDSAEELKQTKELEETSARKRVCLTELRSATPATPAPSTPFPNTVSILNYEKGSKRKVRGRY